MHPAYLFLTGAATGLGLIVAIGAQNVFVLRQGIRRERVAVVVAVCVSADILLISLATAGIGAITENAPWLLTSLRWCGVGYLLWFAARSLRSAFTGARLEVDVSIQPAQGLPSQGSAAADHTDAAQPPGGVSTASRERTATTRSAWRITLLTSALTFLNPHVYLDVMMLGTIANQHERRWIFATGVMTASVVWFTALGWGAHTLAPMLHSRRAWVAIDLSVAAIMILVAVKLAIGL